MFFICLLTFGAILSTGCSPKDKSWPYPVLGRDSIDQVEVFEDHSDVLASWARKGIKGATLINIDAHDDIRWRSDENIDRLRRLHKLGAWDAIQGASRWGDNRLYDMGSFIYAAARMGIIKEVYWIIPYPIFARPEPEDMLWALLRSSRLPDSDIEGFSTDRGCFRGRAHGIPLNICGIESLPSLKRPVVLSIDSDFFPVMAEKYDTDIPTAIERVFEGMYKQQYPIQHSFVAYSVNGNYTPVSHRWLGEWIRNMVSEPQAVGAPPPDIWLIFEHVDYMLKTRRSSSLLDYLTKALDRFGDDPAILLYMAYAKYQLGRLEESFFFAERSCIEDSHYCGGLADLGVILAGSGNVLEGERFFARAYRHNPNMMYHTLQFADMLKEAGYKREAIAYYKKYSAWFGTSLTGFLIGDLYDELGEHGNALVWYEKAYSAFLKDPYAEMWQKPMQEAVYMGISFFESNGYREHAERLKREPRVKRALYAGYGGGDNPSATADQ